MVISPEMVFRLVMASKEDKLPILPLILKLPPMVLRLLKPWKEVKDSKEALITKSLPMLVRLSRPSKEEKLPKSPQSASILKLPPMVLHLLIRPVQ